MIKITRDMAWSAAFDAGYKNMKRNSRTYWSKTDFQVAAMEFRRLWPLRCDLPGLSEKEEKEEGK